MRIAIASNRHLHGANRMRMPVSKRFEWDIARDERLVVGLEPKEEVGDPVNEPDVRIRFGSRLECA